MVRLLAGAFVVLLAFGRPAIADDEEGATASRANFRAPARQYEKAAGDLNIYVEQSLAGGDRALRQDAEQKLRTNLHEIFAVLPERAAGRLQ